MTDDETKPEVAERPDVLYSISAWGIRTTKKHPLVQPLLGDGVVKINAGVGVRWDRKTGEFRVAVSVCNNKDRFIKKIARNIVQGRLLGVSPVGCYHGERPITELFVPITKAFKNYFLTEEARKPYRGFVETKSLAAVMAAIKEMGPKGVLNLNGSTHTCGK